MKKRNSIKFILGILLVMIPSLIDAKTLYMFFVDKKNMSLFNKYIKNELKIKNKDKFIFIDSTNCQLILEKEMNSNNLVRRYSEKDNFFNLFYKNFEHPKKGYLNLKNSTKTDMERLQLLSSEKNDFARQLKMSKDMIEIYKNIYKNITVLFFGNSYLHNAYGHNFNIGIPSDGFIYLPESEFNAFNDIDAKGVKFGIFYDSEPDLYSSTKMYRFYKKLFRKKFSVELSSFNKTTAKGLAPKLKEDENSTFLPEIVTIVPVDINTCKEHDEITKSDLTEVAKIKVEIVNNCRKNSILSFSHNGEKRQVLVDSDGRAEVTFKKIKGENIIKYIDLNGNWEEIFNDNAIPIQNELAFQKDEATMSVHVVGRNPLRVNNTNFQLNYVNMGAIYNLKVKDGRFEKTIPLEAGKNIFKWKDMQGEEHSKEITFYPKCTDKVDYNKSIAEEYGVVQVTLENSCRENGSPVIFTYSGKEYTAIVIEGKAQTNIVLKYDVNEIFYKNFDGNNKKLATVKIRDFSDLIRFMITFKDNVTIYEHIYETNITPTEPVKSIDYTDRSLDRDGHLHINNLISTKGTILISEMPIYDDLHKLGFRQEYKQVYITRKPKQGSGKISFYVDYFSRHGTMHSSDGSSKPPLCHNRSLGGVVVNYDLLINGTSVLGKKFLNPSKCKSGKPTPKDQELILIKEVILK